MIISHRHKFIFIKTRKTAGTSLEIALSKYCGPDDIITPISQKDELTRKNLGCRMAQNYLYSLSQYTPKDIVRLLYFQKRIGFFNHISANEVCHHIPPQIWNTYYKFCFERNPFDKIISRYYWQVKNPEKISLTNYIEKLKYKASDFDLYTNKGKIIVDEVFPYENMESSLVHISSKLGFNETLDLTNIKAKGGTRKEKTHYKALLSEKDIELIKLYFSNEISTFDYRY